MSEETHISKTVNGSATTLLGKLRNSLAEVVKLRAQMSVICDGRKEVLARDIDHAWDFVVADQKSEVDLQATSLRQDRIESEPDVEVFIRGEAIRHVCHLKYKTQQFVTDRLDATEGTKRKIDVADIARAWDDILVNAHPDLNSTALLKDFPSVR